MNSQDLELILSIMSKQNLVLIYNWSDIHK